MTQYTILNRNKLGLQGKVFLSFWLFSLLVKSCLQVNTLYIFKIFSTVHGIENCSVHLAMITLLLAIISIILSRRYPPRLNWKTHTLNLFWSLTSSEVLLDSWSLTRQSLDNILWKAIEFRQQSLWIYLFAAKAFNLLC